MDDIDLPTLNMRDINITAEEVMEDMQESMQESINRWEGGLKATGGAIAPGKSWVYAIDFTFDDKGDWSYTQPEEIDFDFTVKDHNDEV